MSMTLYDGKCILAVILTIFFIFISRLLCGLGAGVSEAILAVILTRFFIFTGKPHPNLSALCGLGAGVSEAILAVMLTIFYIFIG